MIVKEIIKICKREKEFCFYNRAIRDEFGREKITQQFLGTHNAAYLLPGGVSFDPDTICAAFDIEFGEEHGAAFEVMTIGEDFDATLLEDAPKEPDLDLDRSPLTFSVSFREMFPVYEREETTDENGFKSPSDYRNYIHFVESELMRPVAKEKDIELKLRGDWIVVKQGLILLARIGCAELTELEEEVCSRFSDGTRTRYGAYAVRKERERRQAAQSKAAENEGKQFNTCPDCGANLDKGEVCDCQKEKEGKGKK